MSSIVCGGFTLLGALMVIGGTTQKVAVTGVLLVSCPRLKLLGFLPFGSLFSM